VCLCQQLLEGEEVMEAESPETKTMFIVDKESKNLLKVEQKWFHTKTARLLYLQKEHFQIY
jgi:hypothetical protein